MGRYSFTKAERIVKKKDFESVRKQGRKLVSQNLVIFLKANNLDIRRLGLAVSSKVGSAVKRNRIKRLLRECFRLNKETFPPSSDMFISVKPGFNLSGYQEVEEELKKIFGASTYVKKGSDLHH